MEQLIEKVRTRLQEMIAAQASARKHGVNQAIAQAANLNASTVSRFRRGVYRGDNVVVAGKVAQALASLGVADAIASGDWKANWIVKRGKGVKIIRTRATLDRMLEQNPDLHVVQIWIGPGVKDLKFTETSSS